MTAPKRYVSLKVSPDTRDRIMGIGAPGRLSNDEVLIELMDPRLVRVPATGVQRERWMKAAQGAGVPLEEFLRHCIESALGDDSTLIQRTYLYVRALTNFHGVNVVAGLNAPVPDPTPGT